jgi:hypothetical protein
VSATVRSEANAFKYISPGGKLPGNLHTRPMACDEVRTRQQFTNFHAWPASDRLRRGKIFARGANSSPVARCQIAFRFVTLPVRRAAHAR